MLLRIAFKCWLCACLLPSTAQALENPLSLLRAGEYERARTALQPIIAGRQTQASDAAVFEAMILAHQGKKRQAISILRSVVQKVPSHEAARRELVFLLAREGQHQSALYHAERLAGQTADRRLAADLSRYIASASLGKPRGLSFRFAFLPSSNINQGTDVDSINLGDLSFRIDDASRARSGIGISAGVTGWNRWRLSPKWDATAQASIDGKIYPDLDIDPELTFGARLDFGRALPRGRLSFGPSIETLMRDGDTIRQRSGVNLSWTRSIDRKRALSLHLSGFHQSFPGRHYQDGTLLQGSIGYRHIISPSTVVTFSMPFIHENTGRDHLDHKEIGLSLGVAHDWRGGLSTALTLGASLDRYKGDYPGMDRPRWDREHSIGLRIKHRKLQIGRFVPEFSYNYTRSKSNVAFFDYDSHDVGLALSSKF